MCGIAGIFQKSFLTAEPEIIRSMLKAMEQRGPDGEGIWSDSRIILGHRRLSIIDLEGGAQPMSNEDGSLHLVFNGEIFNFRELRSELSAKGHAFRTNSDTECILHLYEQYGMEECLKQLDGFFAFALYDAKEQKLFLCRDRLGVKPLHYFKTGNSIIFASTLKALKRHPDFPADLNLQSVWDFLSLQYIPQGTVYEKVSVLNPGHFLVIDSEGAVTERCWWHPDFSKTLDISYDEAKEELRRLFRKAVAGRLISDVPLGVFLSGGMDSAIVAGAAAEQMNSPLKCFSIAFEEKQYDESEDAKRNAETIRKFAKYGLEHQVRVVNPCDPELLKKLIAECGEPYADASLIPTALLSSFAKENVTVALSGDGADEFFFGYERYLAMKLLRCLDCSGKICRNLLAGFAGMLFHDSGERTRSARLLRLLHAGQLDGAARYLSIVSHTDESLKQSFAGTSLQGLMPTLEQFNAENLFERCGENDGYNQCSEFDIHTYLPLDILKKADTASMSASLEVRSPFLDHHIAEFAAALPCRYKESRGFRKKILAETFASYLPQGLARKRKRGFGVPLAAWFRREWKDQSYRQLMEGLAVKNGFFTQTGLQKLFQEHCTNGPDRSYALFSALVFEIFLQGEKM